MKIISYIIRCIRAKFECCNSSVCKRQARVTSYWHNSLNHHRVPLNRLFSFFQMLHSFNENYITVFAGNLSYRYTIFTHWSFKYSAQINYENVIRNRKFATSRLSGIKLRARLSNSWKLWHQISSHQTCSH